MVQNRESPDLDLWRLASLLTIKTEIRGCLWFSFKPFCPLSNFSNFNILGTTRLDSQKFVLACEQVRPLSENYFEPFSKLKSNILI